MISSKILQVFPWSEIQEAHKELETNKNACVTSFFPKNFQSLVHNRGKIIVEVA